MKTELDWSRIDTEVSKLETLSPEEAREYLDALECDSPEIAKIVAGFAERQSLTQSFMQTSAPDAAKAAGKLPEGTMLGIWRLGAPLGSGGMGAVYKAERADGLFKQTAAVKVVQVLLDHQRVRFDQERQRLARMEHPGIVRIIDGGVTEDDLAYLVMEYVDGVPIDQWISENNADTKIILRKLIDAAAAISHAHNRLILHRDIKPANILVSHDGQARLIDFGIGAELDDDEDAPAALTLAYAAPEQLHQRATHVGSDIFALGVALHQILTGVLPKRRADGGVVIDESQLPNKELRAIIAKAVAFDPADRYASIDLLTEDIGRYLDGQPVQAYSIRRTYRMGKFFARYPASTGLAAGLLLALVGGLSASLYSADRATKALEREETARVRAENALERERIATISESAFSETLLSLFGGDLEADALIQAMLQRADEAHGLNHIDPERAAKTAFAIGRSLIFRREYGHAREVLEPWITGGYGPEHLIWQGKVDLGIAFKETGERTKALKLLQQSRAYFEQYADAPTYDKVVTLHAISGITRREEDFLALAANAEAALDTDAEGNERSYYLNSLDMAYTRLGDFDAAAQYADEGLAYLEANPLLDRHRLKAARVNAASFDIYHTRRFDRARQLLIANLTAANSTADQNTSSLWLLGNLENELGRHEEAERFFEDSLEISKARAKPSKSAVVTVYSDLVETMLLTGDIEKAENWMGALNAYFDDDPPWHPRLVIAEAHYLMLAEGHEAALAHLAENGVTPMMARSSHIGTHRMKRFREMGLDVDSLDAE